MRDLAHVRNYLAGLIRKERSRRRKAETSVTELEAEVQEFARDRQNWKTLANAKGAELASATERVYFLEQALADHGLTYNRDEHGEFWSKKEGAESLDNENTRLREALTDMRALCPDAGAMLRRAQDALSTTRQAPKVSLDRDLIERETQAARIKHQREEVTAQDWQQAACENIQAALDTAKATQAYQAEPLDVSKMSPQERAAWSCEARGCPGCSACEPTSNDKSGGKNG